MNPPTDKAWAIRRWGEVFERSDCRKVKGPLRWVSQPCHHDTCGFRYLTTHDNGPALYGAWTVLVGIAAKCPVRGVLASADRPLTAMDLQVRSGFPAALFDELLAAVSDPTIGWVELVDWPVPAASGPRGDVRTDSEVSGDTRMDSDTSEVVRLQDPTRPDKTGHNPTRPDKGRAGSGFT